MHVAAWHVAMAYKPWVQAAAQPAVDRIHAIQHMPTCPSIAVVLDSGLHKLVLGTHVLVIGQQKRATPETCSSWVQTCRFYNVRAPTHMVALVLVALDLIFMCKVLAAGVLQI
jgi:hypothetical protein